MDLNNKNIEEIKLWVNEFHNIYEYKSSINTKSDKQKILGDNYDRKCRFCGKDKTQTTFKKQAHVIPAFMGNTHVKSTYECDNCNSIFGKYENDLASFIGIRRFYFSTESFKNRRKRVFKKENSIAELYPFKYGISVIDPKNEIFELLEDGKTKRCKINKTSFIPLNVYKALVKIVLSILYDEAISCFPKTLDFLINSELDDDNTIKLFAKLSLHAINDFHTDYPIVFTYSKLDEIEEYEVKNNLAIPDKTFVIYFNQFCFQIFLPFDIKDKKISERKNILLPCFPPILTEPKDITIMTLYPEYYHSNRDLSSKEKIKDEKDEFYFRNLTEPILVEYTEKEHNEMIKKFGLREIKDFQQK